MVTCKRCGKENIDGNKFCVSCGNTIEITKEYLEKIEREKQSYAIHFLAYFFIGLGGCILFGGVMTIATSAGTIISDISNQVATPYIIIGFIMMLIGLIIYATGKK